MRTRLIFGGVVAATAVGLALPALAAPAASAASAPAACVVVNGPNGATIQVGYAPNGPSDCTALP